MNHSDEVVQHLEAISDPIRMKIIFLIGCQGKLNVTEISSKFSISRPAISHHLKVLKNFGLLHCERSGKEIFYYLNKQKLVKQLRALADTLEQLDQLDQLDQFDQLEKFETHETHQTNDTNHLQNMMHGRSIDAISRSL
jgi:DNA-binding transcriptional ArsR family regulator